MKTISPFADRVHVTSRAAAAPAAPDHTPPAGVAFLPTQAPRNDQRAADPSKSAPVGSLIRACACCELEHGLLNRRDNRKTHGHCRRHFQSLLVDSGLSAAEAWLETDQLAPSAFCPDLGPVLQAA